MNGDPQKRKVLYEALTKDGYALGTLDEFSSKMDDPNKAKALYDGITKDGYQVGDFETFNAKVGSPKPAALSSMTTPVSGAAAGPSTGSGMQQAALPDSPQLRQPPSAQATQQAPELPESVQPVLLDEAGDQLVEMPAEFLTKTRQREAWRIVTTAPDKVTRDAAMSQIQADRDVRSKMDRVFAQKQEDRRLVDEQVSRDLQFSLPPQEVPSGLPEGQGPATSMLDPREQKVRADYMNSLTPEQQAYRASKQEAGQWADRDAFDEDVSALTHAMNVLDARERRLLRKSEFRKAQQTDAAGDMLFQDNSDVMVEAQDIDLGKQYVIKRLQSAVRRHPEYASEELARKAKTFQADIGAMVNPAAYSVAQPIRFALDKFAGSILTTPRSFGGAEYGPTDQLAEWAERSMEYTRSDEPTKFRGSIIDEDGAVNPERILPKVVETIAQAALLMGTSPTRPALLASSFVQTNGDYYKEATTRGLTHDQAKKFAWSAAALTSALEMASPNDAARQMVAGTIRREIADGLEQGLTTKEILKRASAAAGKEVLPEAGQEGGQYLGDKGAAYLTNRILGSDNLDDEVKFTEFTENSLLGGVVGGLSGGGTESMRLASIQETAANPQKVAEAAMAMGDEKAAEKVQRIVNTYEANGLPKVAPEKAAMAADAIIRKDDLKERIAQAPMDPAIEAVSGDPRRSEEIALTARAMMAMGIEPSKAAMALAGQGMLDIPEGAKVKKMADGTVDIEVKEPKEGEEGVSKKEVQADLVKKMKDIAAFEAAGEISTAPSGIDVPEFLKPSIPANISAIGDSDVSNGAVSGVRISGPGVRPETGGATEPTEKASAQPAKKQEPTSNAVASVFSADEATGVDEEPTAAPTGVPEGGVPVSTEAAIQSTPFRKSFASEIGVVKEMTTALDDMLNGWSRSGLKDEENSIDANEEVQGIKAVIEAIDEHLSKSVPEQWADEQAWVRHGVAGAISNVRFRINELIAVAKSNNDGPLLTHLEGMLPAVEAVASLLRPNTSNATNEGSTTTTEAPAAQAPEDTGDPAGVPPAPEPAARFEPVLTQDVQDDRVSLAAAYEQARMEYRSDMNPDYVIDGILRGAVNEESFYRFGDRNTKSGPMAKTYFAKKSSGRHMEKSGKTMDVLAQEASEATGREVSPNDLVAHMNQYGSGLPMTNARMRELDQRHGALHGTKLNSLVAKSILAKNKGKVPKFTPNEQAIVDRAEEEGVPIEAVDDQDIEDFDNQSDEDADIMFSGGPSTTYKFDPNAKRGTEQVQPGATPEDAGAVRGDESQGTDSAADKERQALTDQVEEAKAARTKFEKDFKKRAQSLFDTGEVQTRKEAQVKKAPEPGLFQAEGDTRATSSDDFAKAVKPYDEAVASAEKALADYDAQGGAREKAAAQQTSIDQATAKEATKVRLHGNVYDLVEERPDGTATLRNDQGDEFDTDASETYTKLASVEKPIASDKEIGTKKQFVQKELDGLRQRRKAAYDDAVRAAESLVPSDTKIPVGITKLTWLNSRPRPSKEQKAALTKVRVAEDNLNADTRSDAENYGRVYDKLQAPAQAEAPLPKTITIDGKDRSTTNSNGNPLAQTEEGVRNFYKWFGDSRVVDEQGRPLVMYHGTNQDFDTFDKGSIGSRFDYSFGFHLTNRPEEAGIYADSIDNAASKWNPSRFSKPVKEGAAVMAVYVRAETPLDIKTNRISASMEADANKGEIVSRLVEAKRNGAPYDSVIIETERKDEWFGNNIIVFDPSQIKSATGNSGAFDPKSGSLSDYEAKARKAAAILEKAKLKPDQLYALPLPPSVWNGAITAMQEVIIAGGKAADAIAAAIKHIQNSDWWKNKATQKEKDEVMSHMQGRISDLETAVAAQDVANLSENIRQAREFGKQKEHNRQVGKNKEARKERSAKQQEARKEFVQAVKDALKPLYGRMTSAQVKSITAAAAKANPASPQSVSRFERVAAKVMAKANYANDLSKAKQAQKRAKKLARQADVPLNHREALKAIGKVDVGMLDDPAEFIGPVQEYLQQFGAIGKNYQPGSSEAIIDAMGKLQEQTMAEYRNMLMEEFGVEAGAVDPQQLYDALESEDFDAFTKNLEESKKKEVADAIRQVADYSKMGLESYENEDLSATEKKTLETLQSIDIDLLSTDQQKEYIKVADNITLNDAFYGAGKMEAVAKATQGLAAAEKAVKSTPMRKVWTSRLSEMYQQQFASVSGMFRFLFGQGEGMAKFHDAIGMTDLILGKKKVDDAVSKAGEKMADFYTNLRKKYKDADTDTMRAAEGIAAYVLQPIPNVGLEESFSLRKQQVADSIAAKSQRTKRQDEAEVEQRAFDLVLNDATTREELIKAMKDKAPSAWASVEFLANEVLKPSSKDVLEHRENFWNEAVDVDNPMYLPISYRFLTSAEIAEDMAGSFGANEKLRKPKESANLIKRESVKTLPKDRVIDMNVRRNTLNALERNLYDTYTSPAWQQMREFFRLPKASSVVGGLDNSDFMQARLNDLRSAQMREGPKADNLERAVSAITNTVRKAAAQIALGGFTQAIKQPADQLTNAMVNVGPEWVGKSIMQVNKAEPLLQLTSIGDRGELIGGTNWDNTLEAETASMAQALRGNKVERFEAATERYRRFLMAALTKSDVLSARTAWLAYYQKFLADKGIEVSDWQQEADMVKEGDPVRRQALAFAEVNSDITQGSSDPTKQAKLGQRSPQAWANLLKAAVNPFSSFVIGMRERIVNDASDLMFYGGKQMYGSDGKRTKEGERAAIAGRSLMATLSSNLMFTVAKVYIAKTLIGLGADGIRAVFAAMAGDDEDEKQKGMAMVTLMLNVLYTMRLMDADVYRMFATAYREEKKESKMSESKKLDAEQDKALRDAKATYTQVMQSMLTSGFSQFADNNFVDAINWSSYMMQGAAGELPNTKSTGAPMKYEYWVKQPEYPPLYRYGQGYSDADYGVFSVLWDRGDEMVGQIQDVTGFGGGKSTASPEDAKKRIEAMNAAYK